ncbi:hypothetical protein SSX86_016402 [Deinandra increscens subsp. villosa]|uniref:Zinc finger CCCH domain-containing protein 44-like n=1 Tax=Deinandra increscens subsp. villosa TaxID=3103831 RepID=A0AAP0D5B5_9ASTR
METDHVLATIRRNRQQPLGGPFISLSVVHIYPVGQLNTNLGQNLGAEGQVSDRIQPISDGATTVDAVDVAADGLVKVELGSGERRKRGRPPKAQVKPPPAKRPTTMPPPAKKIKQEEEDVCFICFDGGSLVLCDHRGCPKAYHPACIKRDEEFFESAAKWNCGWHICSICQKTAHHMCYTCTYSLCRGCIRKADYVCVRGDKGLCTICMKTIMLIENNGQGEDGKVQADFDDKLSWEYLFKVYWVYIKGKLSLTLDELIEAKTHWKEANTISPTLPSTGVNKSPIDLKSVTSATSIGDLEEENESKRRKKDEQINIQKESVNMEKPGIDESATTVGHEDWATKELLDFVAHMQNGNTNVLSQFDVQSLMMEYINRNNLSDPKKKNQIICDSRLKSLFGKPRVGHSQMLKLLEYHFVVKEDSRKRRVNRAAVRVDPDWNSDNMLGKDKKRKSRNKGEEHVLQNNLNEFAAVDVHNINLIYLRRDLMGNLLEDSDSFHGKVVGSVVRIRISGCDLKHDMYRLVQVVGTSKVGIPYKIDSKLTDITLEVLNLDKKETISIDAISDQEFSEEECRRLQRSIRCGLVKHFTVGEIQEKAKTLQSVKLNDWMAREILRLNHLCDAASKKGHKKSYREYMEKIQLLKTLEEQECRLKETPVVHFDPKMNPDYESDDTEEYFNKEHGDHVESKYSGKKSRPPKKRENRPRKDEKPDHQVITTSPIAEEGSTIHMEKDASASTLENSQRGEHMESKYSGKNSRPPKRRESRPRKDEKPDHQTITTSPIVEEGSTIHMEKDAPASTLENSQHGEYMESKYSVKNSFSPKKRESRSQKDEKPDYQTITTSPIVEEGSTIHMEKDAPTSTLENSQHEADCNGSTITKLDHHATLSSSLSNSAPQATVSVKDTSFPNDTVWHYLDPNGKVQGPFSLVQLQRWSTTGYFPAEMRIWANHEDESLLLTDVLEQQFPNHEKITVANKVGNQPDGANVGGEVLLSTAAVTPYVSNLVNHEKLSESQSFGQNWSATNNSSSNLNYNPPSVESTVQLDTSAMPTPDIEKYEADIKHASTTVVDLPGPTQKMVGEHDKIQSALGSKVLVQDPLSWSSASSLVVGGAKLPVSANGLVEPDKRREWDSGIVLEVAADHVATPTSNIHQNVNPSQPTCNDFTWQGMGEMIEFSTLAEESVSDLLAEVDAMESQYGLPSPTSRRNSFVDDLFNGSFDEFSPTPDQGTRSDGFSSSGDIQLHCQSTTTPDEHLGGSSQSNNINGLFDFMKTSNGLQQHSSIGPEIKCQTMGISTTTTSGSIGFKWPEIERPPQGMIDINRSAKAEGDEGETETKTGDVQHKMKLENGNHNNLHQSIAGGGGIVHNLESAGKMKSGEHSKEMQAPKPIGIGAKLVTRVAQIKGLDGTANQQQPLSPPPLPPPLTLGLDPYDPCNLGSETIQCNIKFSSTGRPGEEVTNTGRSGNIGWDPNQRKYGGERYNSSYSQVEESGHSRNSRSSWNKNLSFGSDSGGGGNSRPPAKPQRVCRFYETGRCKKGASCKYLHPSP